MLSSVSIERLSAVLLCVVTQSSADTQCLHPRATGHHPQPVCVQAAAAARHLGAALHHYSGCNLAFQLRSCSIPPTISAAFQMYII